MPGKHKTELKICEAHELLKKLSERWPKGCMLKSYGRDTVAFIHKTAEDKVVETKFKIPNFRAVLPTDPN